MKKFLMFISILVCVGIIGYCIADLTGYKDKVMEVLGNADTFNSAIENSGNRGSNEFEYSAPIEKLNKTDVYRNVSTKVVNLYLGDKMYYPIVLPEEIDVITDNSKYIYAADRSVSIQVLSNISVDSFSSAMGIKNAESIRSNLIAAANEKTGTRETALLVANDKAILVRTYNNVTAYETILKCFQENTYKISSITSLVCNDKDYIDSIPVYVGYKVTIKPNLDTNIQELYDYSDGCLQVARELRKFEDAVEVISTKTIIAAGTDKASKVYSTDNIYYAEIGNYTIAVYNVNFNTVLTCFGVGNEARFNTIAFINSQE